MPRLGPHAAESCIRELALDAPVQLIVFDLLVRSGASPLGLRNGSSTTSPGLDAKVTGATLVIVKLDRLSRNAAFLLTLRDSGVRFAAPICPRPTTSPSGSWRWWPRLSVRRFPDAPRRR
jgi:hypothetical protein